MDMNELIEKVEEWARVRRLHTADPKAQALKVIEEFTEMMMAFKEYEWQEGLKVKRCEVADVIDGVGDTYVTLIILCQQLKVDFENTAKECTTRSVDSGFYVINELATGISKGNKKITRSAIIGLVEIARYVALYIGEYPKDCLEVAYNEIKDRKGMLIDGTFVKYDDLSDDNKAVLDNA